MKKHFIAYCLGVLLLSLLSAVFAQEWKIGKIIYGVQDSVSVSSTTSLPHMLWYDLYNMHMLIDMWALVVSGNMVNMDYIILLQHLKDVSTYNVLDLLDSEMDKRGVMDQYLATLDTAILKSDFVSSVLKEEMAVLNADMSYCLTSKKESDANYIDSVNDIYERQLMDQSLQDSIKYGVCAAEKRVQYNAKKIVLDKLNLYADILAMKYSYLSKNNDTIVDHYDLIRSDLLENLLSVKRMLEKYDY